MADVNQQAGRIPAGRGRGRGPRNRGARAGGRGRGGFVPPRVRYNALRGDLPDLVTPPGYIGVRVSKIGAITSAEVTRDGVTWIPIHGIPADMARHRQDLILARLEHRGVRPAALPGRIDNPVTIDQVNAHYSAFRWGFTPQVPPTGADEVWNPRVLTRQVLTEDGWLAQQTAVHQRSWAFFRDWDVPILPDEDEILIGAGMHQAPPEEEEEEEAAANAAGAGMAPFAIGGV